MVRGFVVFVFIVMNFLTLQFFSIYNLLACVKSLRKVSFLRPRACSFVNKKLTLCLKSASVVFCNQKRCKEPGISPIILQVGVHLMV